MDNERGGRWWLALPYWPTAEAVEAMRTLSPPRGAPRVAHVFGRDCFDLGGCLRADPDLVPSRRCVGLSAGDLADAIQLSRRGLVGDRPWTEPDWRSTPAQLAGLGLQLYGWALWRGSFEQPAAGCSAAVAAYHLTVDDPDPERWARRWFAAAAHCCRRVRDVFDALFVEHPSADELDALFDGARHSTADRCRLMYAALRSDVGPGGSVCRLDGWAGREAAACRCSV